MLEQAVALGRPALRTAEREHSRVLPRAVVLELRALEGAALEVVLGRRRLREERPDRLELGVVRQMRGRGDREVAVIQVLTRARERQRLDRLRGRAHERDEVWVSGGCDHLPVLDGHSVHPVCGLDGLATQRRYPDRLSHEAGTLVPELPEMEAWRRELDGPVSAFSISKAGPAHIATMKTFDPPLTAVEG